MTLLDKNREPSARELQWFGLLAALFLGLLGGLAWWRNDSVGARNVFWGIGLTLVVVYYAVPPLRRTIFMVWMALVYPIGWTVSHLLLALTYYLVLTPIGLAIRFKRDPMQRNFNRNAATYWTDHDPSVDTARYFRQF